MDEEKAGIARLIDHTLLRPDATVREIEALCSEAVQFGFHSVCVHPFFVPLSKGILSGSGVKVTSVIGFPFGMTLTQVKVYEALETAAKGCDELDIVMNIGMAKSGAWAEVEKDLSDVISATRGIVHKVIIETCYLSGEEKRKASEIAAGAEAEFIKTSTGFGTGGATVEDVRLIREVVGVRCGIKASGGIKTVFQVRELIEAGATRIGTSAGVEIVTSNKSEVTSAIEPPLDVI